MGVISKQTRTAIVLFNLGGPDKPESVEPFLFNLFNDPAIIGAPKLIRYFLARLISSRRAPVAAEIYEHLGGKSPIMEQTETQRSALENRLKQEGDVQVFTCMRYWHPMSKEVVQAVKAYAPDHVILLPLYPQFSTTTTGSSTTDWKREAARAGLNCPHTLLCCYPTHSDFIAAHTLLLREEIEKMKDRPLRLLFSAHGLPEKIIRKGDPYQWQVEQTVKAVMDALRIPGLDVVNCYQSRVGPLKWIGPATDDEIKRAGAEGKALILIPIAFVSEHSETLVELDIEYRHLAEEAGVREYIRIPTLRAHEGYIEAMAALCLGVEPQHRLCSQDNRRICPDAFRQCPYAKEEKAA